MAAFVALEVAEAAMQQDISSKRKELSDKMTTADTDIAAKINDSVLNYINAYKANNNLISADTAKGLDLQSSRSMLMQFCSQVTTFFINNGGLTVDNFRSLAGSARLAYDEPQLIAVYNALDYLNLMDKSDANVQKFFDQLKAATGTMPVMQANIITSVCIGITLKQFKISEGTIEECAKAAEIPIEEVEYDTFGLMGSLGKFAAGVSVVMVVVDVILNITDIIDIVKQCKEMVNQLQTVIEPNYKDYFNNIKAASQAYVKAITPQ